MNYMAGLGGKKNVLINIWGALSWRQKRCLVVLLAELRYVADFDLSVDPPSELKSAAGWLSWDKPVHVRGRLGFSTAYTERGCRLTYGS